MTYFWLIFTDFQNEVSSSNFDISAKYQPNYAFYGSKSKLALWRPKTIPSLEIKDLVFMLHSIKQGVSFDSPAISYKILKLQQREIQA